MPGPATKPTALKRLAGNPGKRALPPNEPQYANVAPDAPAFLNDAAKAEWDRVSVLLLASGVLTNVDRAVLAGYCQWWATFEEACKRMKTEGMTQTNEKGFESVSAWARIANDAQGWMIRCMGELGLTPASRVKVKATPPKAVDPFAAFLGEGIAGKIG